MLTATTNGCEMGTSIVERKICAYETSNGESCSNWAVDYIVIRGCGIQLGGEPDPGHGKIWLCPMHLDKFVGFST